MILLEELDHVSGYDHEKFKLTDQKRCELRIHNRLHATRFPSGLVRNVLLISLSSFKSLNAATMAKFAHMEGREEIEGA